MDKVRVFVRKRNTMNTTLFRVTFDSSLTLLAQLLSIIMRWTFNQLKHSFLVVVDIYIYISVSKLDWTLDYDSIRSELIILNFFLESLWNTEYGKIFYLI